MKNRLIKKIPGKKWQFPRFELQRYRKAKNKYCLCVFEINEGDRFVDQIKKMKPYAKMVDIIIADGGSSDGSITDELLIKNDVTALLIKKGSGKLSAQMRMAFAFVLSEKYQGIIVIDGNNKDEPESIPLFIKYLNEGYDHIQGSRFIKGGKAINTPVLRWIAIKLLHAPIVSLAAGFSYTDTTNGFRAYSPNLLKDKRLDIFRDIFSTYQLHYYLSVYAPRFGYKTIEIPVTRKYPRQGKIPTKISSWQGNLELMRILFRVVTGFYGPRKMDSNI